MRFDRGANARVHLARASMRKHLLLEARQSGQDFSAALECNLGFFDRKQMGSELTIDTTAALR